MGEAFSAAVTSGPLLLAIGAAALAGLVSFLSPCVLPLVPGYLSYVTGLAGADLEGRSDAAPGAGGGAVTVAERTTPRRGVLAVKGRVLAGTLLFIAGFTVVFTTTVVIFTSLGKSMLSNSRALEVGVGVLIIALGLAFVGVIPGLQREFRIRKLPSAGLIGAPVFGAVFALSWVPCVGPTLAAVIGMAAVGGQNDRAVVLAVAYCIGLGLPFVVFGLAFHRLLGVFRAVRRHSRWVTRIGGVLLVLIGLALVTGGWGDFVIWLRTTFGVGEVSI
ncbi:cytochrome c biogenesis CcdA family protein [Melissospora conviva]|uniref:cytochrome c biogenesis CcdA family protein n=1 Tax=Melissospora conviva TaxID=3388432 RepID=UPI003B77063B